MRKVVMTEGPILKSVIKFSIPIILGALIQVGFNAVDLMVVGQMGDASAVAAVGAVGPIVGLLVSSFLGLSAGVDAVLARCLGQNDGKRARIVVSTSLIFSFLFGLFVTVLCLVFSKPLLVASGCEEEYFTQSAQYMNLYAIGIPAIMVYNFASGVIRTSGDTQKPFIYLVIAGVVNVVLNYLLCLVFAQKAAAVALATTISQYVGAVLSFVYILRDKGACNFSFKNIRFSFGELKNILRFGIPSAFNTMLFALSNVQMNAAINSYGLYATAGNAAASTLESLSGSFTNGFSVATVAFVGQNVGAEKPKRVKLSILTCLIVAVSVQMVASLTIFALREQVLSLYIPDAPEAVRFAVSRMRHVLIFMPMATVANIFISSTKAFGYSIVPMLISIIAVLGFRVLWLEAIYPRLELIEHTIDNVYLCYTCSWILHFVGNTVAFLVIYHRYKKGKIVQI